MAKRMGMGGTTPSNQSARVTKTRNYRKVSNDNQGTFVEETKLASEQISIKDIQDKITKIDALLLEAIAINETTNFTRLNKLRGSYNKQINKIRSEALAHKQRLQTLLTDLGKL